jgi:hypothetical protein
MSKFELNLSDYQMDRAFVVIDDRYDVTLIRTANGLSIEVRPITDGEVWDDPFQRFEVEECEIEALELELGHG